MIISKKTTYTLILLSLLLTTVGAQEDPWQEYMKYFIYSPRYFGPNAFPLPELRSGRLDNRYEVEARGEYHTFKGDRTKDVFGRIFIPVAEGLAGVEISGVVYEYYNMTQEIVEERHTAGQSWRNGANGDLIVSALYKLFKNSKRIDFLLEATLKTASGNRIADARYTDAASYWFDLNTGCYLAKNADASSFLRLQALAGFYCWMTNNIEHRQNDAFLCAAGISGGLKNLTFQVDMAGFYGYDNNGDRPLILRTRLHYEYKKNALSLRYKHGIHDFQYDTYSLAYIRYF